MIEYNTLSTLFFIVLIFTVFLVMGKLGKGE
jgi:hypothetical protein